MTWPWLLLALALAVPGYLYLRAHLEWRAEEKIKRAEREQERAAMKRLYPRNGEEA